MYLSLRLPQPLLLEGEAGVGKTEAARALAAALGTPLIRLQCYEGMDSSEALYEWNYPRQLLRIRLAEAGGDDIGEDDLFGREYLIRRPVLEAIEHAGPLPAVLLVDELDRADHDFEAFLLELLADAAVTVPELGTIRATVPPAVVLTSNRTRDLHDALKRRCLYHWIDYPPPAREVEIVRRRVPDTSQALAEQVVATLGRLRAADVQKPPGIAEGIDWVAALELLGAETLDAEAADRTLGTVLKYREDQELARATGLETLVRGHG
jgi:MoxR-like ATPase